MALRTITEMESAPKWEQFQAQAQETFDWQQMRCRLVTPIYGGGTVSAQPDMLMPVRAAAIRGQLRFWWRLLAKHKRTWDLQKKSLRQAEFELWGGMEEEGMAGKVFLRVSHVTKPQYIEYFKKWIDDKKERVREQNKNPELSKYAYVFFAVEQAETIDKTRMIKEGLEWTLQWRFAPSVSDEQKRQVEETLRWWVNFGGIGARTRRGCGAFEVLLNQATENVKQIAKPLNEDEVKAAGCCLVRRKQTPSAEAVKVWQEGVEKLRDFRQGKGVGRTKIPILGSDRKTKSGRSRWPEPDALRRLSGKWDDRHEPNPKQQAQEHFPRGLFGMPVIFQFKDHDDPGCNIQLAPVPDKDKKEKKEKRLASPLIIRPMRDENQQWCAGALVLPYQHLLDLPVEVKGGKLNGTKSVQLWNPVLAAGIRPLQENGGGDPLSAFLHYFQK